MEALILIAVIVLVVVGGGGGRTAALRGRTRPAPSRMRKPTLARPSNGSVVRSSCWSATVRRQSRHSPTRGERYTAAGSQIEQANSPAQARLAKQTAIEGLYYIRAARTAMNLDPGPAIPELDGQRSAGRVTEDRKVDFEGRQVEASPNPSDRTPNYYPGGRVAGRPVPAGWYSEPWWRPALVAGAWGRRVDVPVLRDVLRHGRCALRRKRFRERRR